MTNSLIHDDTDDGGLYYLALDLEYAGLAVASAVTFDRGALMVRLESVPDRQVAALKNWLALLDVADMTVGRFSAAHPMRFLNVRGRMPSGTAVVVTAGWPTGSEQAELIYRDITRQDPDTLIARLIGLEADRTGRSRR